MNHDELKQVVGSKYLNYSFNDGISEVIIRYILEKRVTLVKRIAEKKSKTPYGRSEESKTYIVLKKSKVSDWGQIKIGAPTMEKVLRVNKVLRVDDLLLYLMVFVIKPKFDNANYNKLRFRFIGYNHISRDRLIMELSMQTVQEIIGTVWTLGIKKEILHRVVNNLCSLLKLFVPSGEMVRKLASY